MSASERICFCFFPKRKKIKTFRIYYYNTVYILKIFFDVQGCHYIFPSKAYDSFHYSFYM